ncbi:MAG: hypothetical protein COB04_09295 [Gammaproteobacteria bacterium]|nr:MAG: hypothetical protein COB04_09295 [Gammaproteobacteria bacterium]
MTELILEEQRQLAKRGQAAAQFQLACMYDEGALCRRNLSESVRWFKQAAKQSHDGAQLYLGIMYKEGKGVGKSDKQALSWFTEAANNGNAQAQFNLGVAYYQGGAGIEKGIDNALLWLEKAALQEHPLACFYLGREYYYGENVTRDIDRAFKLMEVAALQKIVDAQHDLGLMYSMMPSEEKYRVNSVVWLQIAADSKVGGYQVIKNQLCEQLKLSRSEIGAVNALLKELRRKLA